MLIIRDRMRSDFVAFVVIFVNQLIVRRIVRNEKCHRDVTTIGISSIFKYSVEEVVIRVIDGIVKGEEYHLRNILWI